MRLDPPAKLSFFLLPQMFSRRTSSFIDFLNSCSRMSSCEFFVSLLKVRMLSSIHKPTRVGPFSYEPMASQTTHDALIFLSFSALYSGSLASSRFVLMVNPFSRSDFHRCSSCFPFPFWRGLRDAIFDVRVNQSGTAVKWCAFSRAFITVLEPSTTVVFLVHKSETAVCYRYRNGLSVPLDAGDGFFGRK